MLNYETGNFSWIGIRIRKGKKYGVIISDYNGLYRLLTVRFSDGTTENILKLKNIRKDPDYIHKYEWHSQNSKRWYRF